MKKERKRDVSLIKKRERKEYGLGPYGEGTVYGLSAHTD
jgi:hypothetical protein